MPEPGSPQPAPPTVHEKPSPARKKRIGQATASGILWMLAKTVGAKPVSLLGQIMLAWFLTPDAFGLVALALTVKNLSALFQRSGVRQVLVHRQAKFDRWATPGFWFSLLMGLGGGALILLLAPLAVWAYGRVELYGLLMILALDPVLRSLIVVPHAALQIHMRFKYIAISTWSVTVGQTLLAVALAWAGFGAYSFIIPMPLASATLGMLYWLQARPRVRPRLQLRRWRLMFSDVGLIMGGSLFMFVLGQADYIILGLFHPEALVGLYFFAFNLSVQPIKLLVSNMRPVLFAALSSIGDDPGRQVRAALHTVRLTMLVGVPVCFLLIALAQPLITIAFAERWWDAMPILQLLVGAMAMQMISISSTTLLNAQGRFATRLILNAIQAGVFIIFVTVAATIGAAVTVAFAVLCFYALMAPIVLYVAIKPSGGRWVDILHAVAPPMGCAALAAAITYLLVMPLPEQELGWSLVRVVATAVSFCAVYFALSWLMVPALWRDLLARFTSLVRRRRKRTQDAAADEDW